MFVLGPMIIRLVIAAFDHKSNTRSKIVAFHATDVLRYGILWLLY